MGPTYLPDTPVKLLLENWLDYLFLERSTGEDSLKCIVEMDEALSDDACLLLACAVLAPRSSTVYERAVRTGEAGGGIPLRGILRDLTDKEQHAEAATDFVLLDVHAGGPVQVRAIARGSGWGASDAERCLRALLLGAERRETGVAVELVDLPGDGPFNSFGVAHVKPVKLRVRVAKLGGCGDFGRLPVGRLSIPERSQVYITVSLGH